MEDTQDTQKKQTSDLNKITPGEITEILIDGQNFEIKIQEIELIFENTVLKFIDKKDYSKISTIKELLCYFYKNENESFEQLKILSKKCSFPEYKAKFYKSIIQEIIMENFKQSSETIVQEILEKLKKIRSNLNKKGMNKEKFNKLLEEELGTNELPKFLIMNDIKYLDLQKSIQEKDKIIQEKIINYYDMMKSGKMTPFEYFKDKSILFNIFVLSNAKDIWSDKMTEDLFFENFYEIRSWFNLNQDLKEYENIFPIFINITDMERNGFLDTFLSQLNSELSKQNNEEYDLYLTLISSFFYCIAHKMKDIKKNNNDINNIDSKVTNFLKNIILVLSSSIKCYSYNIKVLVNLLYEYALSQITKEKGENKINNDNLINIFVEEENIDYDFELIEEIINHCNDDRIKDRFNQIKSKFKLDLYQFSRSLIGNLLQKATDMLTSKNQYVTNYIRLSPFQKYKKSNIITILISGFGSENDSPYISWQKYIENDPTNSTYYFYHWPGDSFTKIIMKSLPLSFGQIIYDTNLPQVFDNSKQKAEYSGKLLSVILLSQKIFGNLKINLVGFSLGSHVVKYCLKDMRDCEEGKKIINDVIFMGGATTFKKKLGWYNIFKRMVGGRIINCLSKKDDILGKLYSKFTGKEPIGLNKIDINDGKGGKNIIENYDFTNMNLGHLDYRKKFNLILKRINES